MAKVKALACALPARCAQPLSRSSTADLVRLIGAHPDAPAMSRSTVWRILAGDARKPWPHRSWRCPRDPQFAAKAGRVLDLSAGWWQGEPLSPDDCLLSAPAQRAPARPASRRGCAATRPRRPAPARRCASHTRTHAAARWPGAPWALAAWDVRRGGREPSGRGRCDAQTGIVAFGQLVDLVLQQQPYRSAPRVCWVVDNGSSHRGEAACQRLQARYPHRILVHLPTHASWLNQERAFN